MPNDVKDWTIVNQVNLVGPVSGKNLGDPGTPIPAADSASDTVTTSVTPTLGLGVLASLKAAAGSTIAQVGALGPVTAGSLGSVTPNYGQNTTAGNCVLAWVVSDIVEPSTVTAGWVKLLDFTSGGLWVALWHHPNCGNADGRPVFTGSGNVLVAQLGEFSGVATTTPSDQTASGKTTTTTLSLANSAADVGFGDLVAMASFWQGPARSGNSWSQVYNNGATAVAAGNFTGGSPIGIPLATSFSYAIVPAGPVVNPVGVQIWPYDSAQQSQPGLGVAPSIVLAATPGKAYTLAMISAGLVPTTGAGDRQFVQALDGVTQVFSRVIACPGVIDQGVWFDFTGLAIKGTVGNSMTIRFGGIGANSQGSLSVGAYLR